MIILAHPKDETCARRLRDRLGQKVDNTAVVFVVSADALAHDGIFDAARRALKAGTLRLFLWRACLVDQLDMSTLVVTHDLKVSRIDDTAPPLYPSNGQWIEDGAELTTALDDLARDLRP